MKKTHYTDEPARIDVAKAYIIYRWCIEREADGEDDETWTAFEQRVDAPVDANKVVKTVFDAYYGNDHENKLINEFNSAQMGIISGDDAERAKTAYANFLTERAALKADIEAAFEDFA